MAKANDPEDISQNPSDDLDQQEVPRKVTKRDVKEYYANNMANYQQVADHFSITVDAVREVLDADYSPAPEA
jgi:hypothetical protein